MDKPKDEYESFKAIEKVVVVELNEEEMNMILGAIRDKKKFADIEEAKKWDELFEKMRK